VAVLRSILWIFASVDVILNGAAFAFTGLASAIPDFSPPLAERYYTDARLPSPLGVFASSTAIFISLPPVSRGVFATATARAGTFVGRSITAHKLISISFYY
jgi:hypothetical protein